MSGDRHTCQKYKNSFYRCIELLSFSYIENAVAVLCRWKESARASIRKVLCMVNQNNVHRMKGQNWRKKLFKITWNMEPQTSSRAARGSYKLYVIQKKMTKIMAHHFIYIIFLHMLHIVHTNTTAGFWHFLLDDWNTHYTEICLRDTSYIF